MGPGIVGTNTRLGFSGMEVGPILDAVESLEGVPIAALRISFADERPRHFGLSHHSATALRIGSRGRALIPIPLVGEPEESQIRAELADAGIDQKHELVDVGAPDVLDLFSKNNMEVVSMGRPASSDPVLVQSAAAAAALAVEYLKGNGE